MAGEVSSPLLTPIRTPRGLNVPGRGAAALPSGSIRCPLLHIHIFLPLNLALLEQELDGGEGGEDPPGPLSDQREPDFKGERALLKMFTCLLSELAGHTAEPRWATTRTGLLGVQCLPIPKRT